jgi:hypothetical protein
MVGVIKRRKRKTERKEMFRLAEFLFKIFDTLNKNALCSIKTNEEDSFTTTLTYTTTNLLNFELIMFASVSMGFG